MKHYEQTARESLWIIAFALVCFTVTIGFAFIMELVNRYVIG